MMHESKNHGLELRQKLSRKMSAIAILLCVPMVGCAVIPNGMGGVEWTPTQGTLKKPLGEGFHVVSPFATIYKIDLREQQHLEDLQVLANNGLAVTIDTSVLYQVLFNELVRLQTEVGPNYYSVLIGPILRSASRKVVGRYSPEEIYSTKREEVEREIFQEVLRKSEGKPFRVSAILIREVHLPTVVQGAIQHKLEEEQKALEMQFVLDREQKEAQRKRIEAGGIADAQTIINKGLTPQLLEFRGIEATEKLALSPNAKVVVIGAGRGGLPVILNPGELAPSQPRAER